MPATVTDDFTGADGTTLNGRATAGGAVWSVAGAPSGIRINAANQLRTQSASSGALARIEAGAADHYAKVTSFVAHGTGGCGVAVRAVDNLNFVALRAITTDEVRLFKRVGSTTDVTIASIIGLSFTLPVVLELRIAGQVVTPYVNGTQVGAPGGYAVSDAVFADVTQAGIWGRGTAWDPLADDFESGTLGAPGASLAPAGGRHTSRAASPALAAGFALAPARAVHAGRAGTATLSVTYALAPAGGINPHRAAFATLSAPGTLLPEPARIGWRGGAPLLVVPGGGTPDPIIIASVPPELRELRVERR